ncbi:MAG: hypothetical protein IRZ21_06770 [Thermoleophilaceae bacterium]|nr:hypothetical protein [Thermoleophilaceae bacterium]
MLFDLKGKRRRAVQGTYLVLALLMGGGLVLFGIGGGTNGGLWDAITGSSGGSQGNQLVEKRIDKAKTRLAADPRNQGALTSLVRDEYTLATEDADPQTGAFKKDAQDNLEAAHSYWQRYLALNPKKVDPSVAAIMVQVYGELGLRRYSNATTAAEYVTEAAPNPGNYLRLAQLATLAGQKDKADLAGQKAIELAPKQQRSSVKKQVEQLKQLKGGTAVLPTGTTGGSG